jgi:hypothetical protein
MGWGWRFPATDELSTPEDTVRREEVERFKTLPFISTLAGISFAIPSLEMSGKFSGGAR